MPISTYRGESEPFSGSDASALMPTIGIDLGGTKCHGVVLDASNEIIGEHRASTRPGNDGVIAVLSQVAAYLCELAPDATAIGVGVPGLVDASGVLRAAPNVAGVRDLDVRSALEQRLDIPVVVDNDATAACWAEREIGAARGADECALVTLGTGIGGGLVAGGRLVRGAHGYAGEFGHMIVNPDGPLCVCGQHGCWERYASGTGLAWLAREAGAAADVRGEDVTAAAARGDAEAIAIMAGFGRWVAVGIANLVNALDPQVIVLGGGLVEAGEVLMQPVRAALDELWLGAEARPHLRVVPAELGERAGSIGAALLAREPSSAYGL